MTHVHEITPKGNTFLEAIKSNELWGYRSLLYFLAKRDISVRYKQAFLGVAWAFIQPIATVVIFAFFFGKLAKFPSGNSPYALMAFFALLPWNFVSSAISRGGLSLMSSSHLISKVYFPRVLVPMSATLSCLVDYGLASLLSIPLLVYYGHSISLRIVWLFPLLTLYCVLLAFSVSLVLSAVNIRYRDVAHVLPFAIQLWMFATPILYPLSVVPEKYHLWMALNPMVALTETFRAAFLGGALPYSLWSFAGVELCGLMVLGFWFFSRQEKLLADLL